MRNFCVSPEPGTNLYIATRYFPYLSLEIGTLCHRIELFVVVVKCNLVWKQWIRNKGKAIPKHTIPFSVEFHVY